MAIASMRVELGLGGSLRGLLRSYKQKTRTWFMADAGQFSLPDAPDFHLRPTITTPVDTTGNPLPYTNLYPWFSTGDSLTVAGDPVLNGRYQQSDTATRVFAYGDLPEGGTSVQLDGVSGYIWSPFNLLTEPGLHPCTFETAVVLLAYPGSGIEPALMGGSDDMAVTVRSDQRVYGYYGGAAVVSAPIPLDTLVHVALTRAGTSPDTVTLWINGEAVDSATPIRDFLAWNAVRFGKHWTNDHFLRARYNYASILPWVVSPSDLAAHAAACAWTDVSNDVLRRETVFVERGIRGDSPLDVVAGTGIASFSFNNAENNSARTLGYYTPGHPNCRPGFTDGVPCRIYMRVP